MLQICRKVDLVVNEGDKESLTFFKTLDKLMIEVKELTVATEDQNLKRIAEIAAREEAEKQRLQAEEEARIIAEIKAKEFEAERRRLQAEEEARRIAEIEAKKAERKRLQAEEEARRISEIKAKEIERRRLQAEEGARCVAELLAKEDFERKRVQAEYEAMKFPKIQGEEIEKQRIQAALRKAQTSAEKWMINFPKPDVSLRKPSYELFPIFIIIPFCF